MLALAAALCTAFYMFRLYYLIFYGRVPRRADAAPRTSAAARRPAADAPGHRRSWPMPTFTTPACRTSAPAALTGVLGILAVGSLVGGLARHRRSALRDRIGRPAQSWRRAVLAARPA